MIIKKILVSILLIVFIGIVVMSLSGQRFPIYLTLSHLLDVATTAPTDNYVLTYDSSTKLWGPEAAAGGDDELVGVDSGATAGYLGVAIDDGVLRFTANEFTAADGGNFVTFSLADHNTARTALGLAIGSDVQAYDADLTTYAGITPSANVQTLLANATFALFMADLSGTAGAAFAWNSQNLTGIGTIGSGNIISTGTILAQGASVTCGTTAQAGTFVAYDGSDHAITLDVPAIAGSFSLTLPTTDGAANEFLESDGSGNLSWVAAPAVASHAMATHSDEDTYSISTSGLATVTIGYVHGAETTATPSGAFTVDWSAKQVQRVTITGVNLDITCTNPAGPCRLLLVVVQGDGDDTIDWTNEADLKWPGGVAPTLSTGAGDVDIVAFYFDGTSYFGLFNGDFQ